MNDAEFSPDGRLVVTASADGSGADLERDDRRRLQTLRAPRAGPRRQVQPGRHDRRDGRRARARCSSGGPETDGCSRPSGSGASHGRRLCPAMAGLLATAGSDGANVWSIPAGRRIRVAQVARAACRASRSRPMDRSSRERARRRRAHLGRREREAPQRPEGVEASADRRCLQSGRAVLLAPACSGTCRRGTYAPARHHLLVGHTGPSGRRFSPDGRWIVTAGATAVGLWQREGDQPYFYLRSPARSRRSSPYRRVLQPGRAASPQLERGRQRPPLQVRGLRRPGRTAGTCSRPTPRAPLTLVEVFGYRTTGHYGR